jgi:endonuclease YncB( thermonuclease family)
VSKSLVRTSGYSKLLKDLRGLIEEAQVEAIAKLNEIRVSTYWEMGQRIDKEREAADPKQKKGLVERLADDLGLTRSLLFRILQFYRTWRDEVPRIERTEQLSWAHFVELLAIKDQKERKYYFKKAAKEGWSRATLRKALEKDLFLTSKSSEKGKGVLERSTKNLHVYKAVVEKVVDGDTLAVKVDLGFNVWVDQRIRFRGINTAELVKDGIKAGKAPDRALKAKKFVEEKLRDIEFIVVRTYKTDMYGRYIADVLYHPTIKNKEAVYEKGFFLNQELLIDGLADLTD